MKELRKFGRFLPFLTTLTICLLVSLSFIQSASTFHAGLSRRRQWKPFYYFVHIPSGTAESNLQWLAGMNVGPIHWWGDDTRPPDPEEYWMGKVFVCHGDWLMGCKLYEGNFRYRWWIRWDKNPELHPDAQCLGGYFIFSHGSDDFKGIHARGTAWVEWPDQYHFGLIRGEPPPPLPGELEFSDLVIEPTEVLEGDNVTISVNVTNVGKSDVTGPVTLMLNGKFEDSQEVTLEPGGSKIVSFIVTKGPGEYTVAIGTLAGTFAVIERPKIAVVSDIGGRGDLSFNDMAFKGGEEAEKDFGVKMVEMISKTGADYLLNLRAAATDPDTILIVGVGYLLSEALLTVAQEYPDKNFAGIDTYTQALAVGTLGAPLPNMMDIKYEEHKGSALVGALAALLAAYYDKPHIGAVLGIEISIQWKFEIGYKWGARWATEWLAANKPEEAFDYTKDFVLWTYTGTFTDITKGYLAALPMYQVGAVAVYNIAGPLGLGINAVVRDIAERDDLEMGPPFWIGADANQDWMNPGFVIASMMKRVDRGVYYATELVKEDKFREVVADTDGVITLGIGTAVAGILMEGISVSTLADLDEFIEMGLRAENLTGEPVLPGPPDWIKEKVKAMRDAQPSWIWDAVAELEQKIRTGEVEVPLAWTADDIAYWRDILG